MLDKLFSSKSFTLIELLVVIGILAILTAAVVVVLNPAEYLKQARDTTRMNDLGQINQALTVLESQGVTSFGTANTVYVSIPDNASSTCGSLGLPTLPSSYNYHCVTASNLQNINGTGWISVDFTQSTALAFSNLPIDPTNTTSTGDYYTYTPGGSWELTALMEAQKHNAAIADGGAYPGLYEKGTNLKLMPSTRDQGLVGGWGFDGGTSGSISDNQTIGLKDSSGNNNNGTASNANGTGMAWVPGKVGLGAVSFDGVDDRVLVSDANSLDAGGAFTVSVWVKWNSFDSSRMIIEKGDGSGNPQPCNYGLWGQNTRFEGYIGKNGVDYNEIDSPSYVSMGMQTGQWYHIAFTADGSNLKLYMNGSLVKSASETFAPVGNTYPLRIAEGSYSNYPFNGLIDDVRIYNRALSATEIQAIYNNTE